MGGYEPNPMPWDVSKIPDGFIFSLLDENWDQFEQLMEHAIVRVPALENTGVRTLTNGPESFTPDGNFILGEAPEIQNFFVGAGFNAYGIASGGGAGKALADWVVNGEQPMDLWSADIRRFSSLHNDKAWVRERTIEACSKHYDMAWPFEEYKSGRPRLTSPLYDRLQKHNASFGSKLGWERPNWFAPAGVEPTDQYSFGRQNWFSQVGEEHRACREKVALFDQSSFAKFELRGEGAESALSWICANNVAKPIGSLIYTQMLNSRGGIECDLTVVRIAEDAYYIVTGTGFRTHDAAWIRQNIPAGCVAELKDITEDWATLSLMGPHARDVLEKVVSSDVSNKVFPFGTYQNILIAGHPVRALRVTYMGELGWELHMPIKASGEVYDSLYSAGQVFGIANAGYRAIESLRLEKGYRAWGADITPSDSPSEAGLGWAVKLKSSVPFLGRDAAESIANSSKKKVLCCFILDDPEVVLSGRETIIRNGESVGYLSSAGWGYTVGKSIGYGYVRNAEGLDREYLETGSYELEVACNRIACDIHFSAPYDPKMEKIKI